MQEEDARRRIAILRGEEPPSLEQAPPRATNDEAHPREQRRPRRDKKRHGEDDTDFELRLAQQNNALATRSRKEMSHSGDAPLFDSTGHIDLLGGTQKSPRDQKNAEFEAERKKKERELEDQYTMRFSNASGRKGFSRPWYSKDDSAQNIKDTPRDAFGREDPGRTDRDERRMNANDPLAMMKRGAAKIRELKQERRKFREEREAELEEMCCEERESESRGSDGRSTHREHRSRDERRRRSRSRSRSPRSSRRRHHSRERHRSRDRTSSTRHRSG